MNRQKFSVPSLFLQSLKSQLLSLGPASEKTEQYCDYRFDIQTNKGWLRVKQYTNGTLYIEATDIEQFERYVTFVSQQLNMPVKSPTTQQKTVSKAQPQPLAETEPYIGTDESGKGDYFGPL